MNAFSGFPTGAILSASLSLLRRNFALFALLGAFAAAPEFLILAMSQDADTATTFDLGAVLQSILPSALATTVTATLSAAIIAYLVVYQMTGRPVRVGEAVAATAVRFPSLLGVSLCAAAALFGGPLLIFSLTELFPVLMLTLSADWIAGLTFMSFTPGLLLLASWYVAIPVCLMEWRGVVQSLSRSSALTKGVRAKLFALVILEIALGYVSEFAPDVVSSFAGASGRTAVQFLCVSLQYAFTGALGGVAYYALCVGKQGVGPGQVAAVFD